jgi:hypothetical protein
LNRTLLRWLPLLTVVVLFCTSPRYVGTSGVSSYSYTDLDYYAEEYYSVETDAYLFAGSSIVDSGTSSGDAPQSVSLGTSTAINTSYYLQTNHWVILEADGEGPGSPYCFSCVSTGWYYGSMSVTVEDENGSDGSVYVGTTYDEGDTDGSPPSISGVDYTTYGTEVRGTSGYVILYGSNLSPPYGSTSIYSDSGMSSPAYASQSQINMYYSIPLDTDSGTYSGDIVDSTSYGSTSANFYVYDPAPSISSISPSTWNAGSATGITISGSGFGSSPSVSFSDSYVSFSLKRRGYIDFGDSDGGAGRPRRVRHGYGNCRRLWGEQFSGRGGRWVGNRQFQRAAGGGPSGDFRDCPRLDVDQRR